MDPKPDLPEAGGNRTSDDLRALTRLVVGGAELSAVELLQRLRQWEQEVAGQLAQQQPAVETTADESLQPAAQARLALIGLLFELQEHTHRSLSLVGRFQRLLGRVLDPLLHPFFSSRFFSPARSHVNRLVRRGQAELDRWVARGQQEEQHSRLLAKYAFDETVDVYLEYLTQNPEVQDLVQQQSTGLANELLEEARERAVSADSFLEGMARALLRRMPRSRLPEPPPELRQAAASRKPTRSLPPAAASEPEKRRSSR